MTRGLLACVAYRSLSSWLVAGPLAIAVGGTIAHHPRGDAALFDRGGLWLLEAARHVAPQLPAVGLATGVLALIVAFGWLLPLGLLLAELAGHRGRAALGEAAQRLGTLSLLLGAFLFLQALIVASAAFSARAGGAAAWSSFVFASALLFSLGALHDAARVARFHRAGGPVEAVAAGARLLRQPALWWAGAWRGLVSALALALGVVAARALAPTSAGAALLAPQLAVMGHLAARASWLWVLTRSAHTARLSGETTLARPAGDAVGSPPPPR
jgi:hypothetical protein